MNKFKKAYDKTKREMLRDLRKNLHRAEHPSSGIKKGNEVAYRDMIYLGGLEPVHLIGRL